MNNRDEQRKRAEQAMRMIQSGREFSAGDLATMLDIDDLAAQGLARSLRKTGQIMVSKRRTAHFPTFYKIAKREAAPAHKPPADIGEAMRALARAEGHAPGVLGAGLTSQRNGKLGTKSGAPRRTPNFSTQRAMDLVASGMTLQQVARELKTTKGKVGYQLRARGITVDQLRQEAQA